MSCTAPIGLEQLVAYWSNDLDAEAQASVEEHLFACDTCFANAQRLDESEGIISVAARGIPRGLRNTLGT